MRVLIFALGAVLALQPQPSAPVEWTLDSLTRVGGHGATLAGNPRLVDTPVGRAVEFDGVDDGLFVEANPRRSDDDVVRRWRARALRSRVVSAAEGRANVHWGATEQGVVVRGPHSVRARHAGRRSGC